MAEEHQSLAGPMITLCEHPNYGGTNRVIIESVPSLAKIGFDNKTSSIVVNSGSWILYEGANFDSGSKSWLVSDSGGPAGNGRYPHWGHWSGSNDTISSVHPV